MQKDHNIPYRHYLAFLAAKLSPPKSKMLRLNKIIPTKTLKLTDYECNCRKYS